MPLDVSPSRAAKSESDSERPGMVSSTSGNRNPQRQRFVSIGSNAVQLGQSFWFAGVMGSSDGSSSSADVDPAAGAGLLPMSGEAAGVSPACAEALAESGAGGSGARRLNAFKAASSSSCGLAPGVTVTVTPGAGFTGAVSLSLTMGRDAPLIFLVSADAVPAMPACLATVARALTGCVGTAAFDSDLLAADSVPGMWMALMSALGLSCPFSLDCCPLTGLAIAAPATGLAGFGARAGAGAVFAETALAALVAGFSWRVLPSSSWVAPGVAAPDFFRAARSACAAFSASASCLARSAAAAALASTASPCVLCLPPRPHPVSGARCRHPFDRAWTVPGSKC